MAAQTYLKKDSTYTANVILPGADVGSNVYVTLIHEWGDAVFNHSKLVDYVAVGATTLTVVDGTRFNIGDSVTFIDGRNESVSVSAVAANILTTSSTLYAHNVGVQVSTQYVATADAVETYHYDFSSDDFNSAGQHKIRWSFLKNGISTTKDIFINVYQPYIDSGTFFDIHPDLEDLNDDAFDATERMIRRLIDTYCGQSFDFYPSKTLIFDGSGRNTLYLTQRLERFSTVSLRDDYSDITEVCEIDPKSNLYLRLTGNQASPVPTAKNISPSKTKWGSNSEFEVTGDWGWSHMPDNITQAATILLADHFNDDTQYPRHGVVDVSMDTHRMRFDSTILGTTGNLDVDVLLLDYTIFTLGQI